MVADGYQRLDVLTAGPVWEDGCSERVSSGLARFVSVPTATSAWTC